MRLLVFLSFFFFINLVHALTCVPVLSLKNPALSSAKEGHDKKISFLDVTVEMDRYCPGENVSLTLLVLSSSAVVGEHLQAEETNTVVISSGQIASVVSIGIIGDNDWNEDRQFSVRIINPSHGSVSLAQSDFLITNDDPKIFMNFPGSVKEPKQGAKSVPLKLQLSTPAERVISGEIEVRGMSATKDEDFITSHTIGFEFLPGESEFEFLPDTLKVLSDDIKEKSEQITFYMNKAIGGSPYPEQVSLSIKDPTPDYRLTIQSIIKGISDAQIAMISNYQHSVLLTESEAATGEYISEASAPKYSHQVTGFPSAPATQPGLLSANVILQDNVLSRLRLEFIESPTEIYPYSPQPLYMFMSSFSKLHEDEFITITNPGESDYPAFDIKQMKKVSDNKWQANYKRSLSEDGAEALQESTTLTLEEIK